MTSFLADHPGGKKILLKNAGMDATKQFDAFHARSVLDKFGPEFYIGEFGDPPAQHTSTHTEDDEHDLYEPFGELIPFGDPAWYGDAESPFYKESHRILRAKLRRFVDTEIMPYCHEWDEAKQIPKALYQTMSQLNLLPAFLGHIPVEYLPNPNVFGVVHADEWDVFHSMIAMDELSRCGSGGVTWGICGGFGIGLPPILLFGSKELKDRIAPAVLRAEKFICLAITEPHAGSDVANLRTTAVLNPQGTHYVVNGEKKWITNSPFADYFTVAVRTGDEGMGGISMLLIERTMPGVKTRRMNCSGVWCSGTGYITFEDVLVPRENIIGQENKGFKQIMFNFNSERLGLAIQANRFARVCLEESIKYAHKRRTFGQKLVDHQVIRCALLFLCIHV